MPYKLTLFQNRPFFFDSLHLIFIGPTGTLPVSHTATQNVPEQSKLSTPFGNDSVGHRVWSAFNLTFPSAITLTMSNSALKSPFEVKNQFPPTQTPTQTLKIDFRCSVPRNLVRKWYHFKWFFKLYNLSLALFPWSKIPELNS